MSMGEESKLAGNLCGFIGKVSWDRVAPGHR